MNTLTVIILAKDEEKMIRDCLESVKFADEVILIDTQSTDKTIPIAKEYDAKIYEDESFDFSVKRNLGLQKAASDWILYVDADERVSSELVSQIKVQVLSSTSHEYAGYRIKRKNYYLGKYAWPRTEKMERLFKKTALKGWEGALHESPKTSGNIGELDGYLLHYTHRNLTEMVDKTNEWSETEASLRFHASHPKMSWWRFPRVMLVAFYDSYIRQGGFRVGTVGLIESMYQSYSMFITYAKLWELQQGGVKQK